ncbi:MAG: hypothetical protein ACE5F9_07510 [Phycisphaerae bacterium]
MIVAAGLMLVSLVGGGTIWWYTASPSPVLLAANAGGSQNTDDTAMPGSGTATGSSPDATQALRSFLGVPVAGRTIGFVIDDDTAMAPYFDDSAFLTWAVASARDVDTSQFAIAVARDGPPSVLPPTRVTEAGLASANSTLYSRFPANQTDLTAAMRSAADWDADHVFLVLASPASPDTIETLVQQARQSGAVTHVFALGAAARSHADFAMIARATGGTFLAVDDAMFHRVIQAGRLAVVARKYKIEKETRN